MAAVWGKMAGRGLFVWAGVLLAFLAFWKLGRPVLPWAFDFPKAQIIPAAKWISAATKWLLNEATFGIFTFAEFTRFIAAVIDFEALILDGALPPSVLARLAARIREEQPI